MLENALRATSDMMVIVSGPGDLCLISARE